jgi:hypothetical protein
MKHIGILMLGLAGVVAFSAVLRAENAVLPDDPYALVVARNIFGLNPPTPVNTNPQDATPPPKITPNGIMTILGQLQVLFKVAGTSKPGVPPVDTAYILSEGQRQDDIEVTKIDEKSGVITFNNHGTVQQLPLEVGKASSSAIASTAAGHSGVPNVPGMSGERGENRAGLENVRGGRRFGGSRGDNNNANVQDDGSTLENTTRNNTFNAASQIPKGMTPEVQDAAIEVNRELTQQQVEDGTLPPLPITPITPADATGVGGAPLVAPPPSAPRP